MLPVRGQCYEIRDKLKALGCSWDAGAKTWFSPDDVHGEAQGLADAENRREWQEYLGTLVWADGEFTATVWNAAMRAASLHVAYAEAWQEIAGCVRAVKAVGDKWFDRNVSRGYAAAAAEAGAAWVAPSRGKDGPNVPREKPVFRNATLGKVAAALAEEIDLPWLAARSPVDPCGLDADGFLSALYEPGERVVCFSKFASQGQWLWDADAGFVPSIVLPAALYEKAAVPFEDRGADFDGRGSQGIWYLCNPVSGEWRWMEDVASGDDPHWSRRFHECVTSWRYLVLESDKALAKDWVAMAVQLPLRIAAIYTSGGKSVHVLVRVDAKSKMQWDEWSDEIKPIVITLGADVGCMSAVRLTRLPACFRAKKGRPQKLLYLNPAPDMTPIASRAVVREPLRPWLDLAESILRTDAEDLDDEQVARCRRVLEFYTAVPEAAAKLAALNAKLSGSARE